MEFVPCVPFDENQGQHAFWDALKNAFRQDEGVAFYRFPVFRPDGQVLREPDVVFAHRQFGVWVFEVKGCRIGNIAHIQGHAWTMHDWHRQTEAPLTQAMSQMYAVQGMFQRQPLLFSALQEHRIPFRAAVVLPFVTETEWQAQGLHLQFQGCVLFDGMLKPQRLRERLSGHPALNLSDEEWEVMVQVLGGTIPPRPPRDNPPGPATDPRLVINHIEEAFKPLDKQQRDAAYQIPPGPQRLRGIAGSGKTLLLAKRAARIHAAHPDWDIAFIFFTKALYQQVTNLIRRAFREMAEGMEPDWNKLCVLHAWGGAAGDGFYSRSCLHHGIAPQPAQQGGNPNVRFHELLKELWPTVEQNGQTHWDAVIIDEGQDLPKEFYWIALSTLRDPKRFYWAYDEAQGIGSHDHPRRGGSLWPES